jgi:uncharacterized RDD family membrane protein YckC
MADFRIDPGSFSGFSPSAESRTVRQVALRTDRGTLLLRRWAGAWIDFIVLFILTWTAGALSPPEGWWINPGLVLWVVHFPVCEWRWGRTLGKLATGLVVVNDKGRWPNPGQALVRTLFRAIEVNPFLFGGLPAGLMVAFTERRQRLGDMVCGTYVILAEDLKFLSADPAVAEVFD